MEQKWGRERLALRGDEVQEARSEAEECWSSGQGPCDQRRSGGARLWRDHRQRGTVLVSPCLWAAQH